MLAVSNQLSSNWPNLFTAEDAKGAKKEEIPEFPTFTNLRV